MYHLEDAVRTAVGIPVVLSTDCGADMDDQWALAHLALTAGVRLLGVVANHAPNLAAPAADTAARNARAVLSNMKLPSPPPVVAGASGPLENRRSARMNAGVRFLLDTARTFSRRNRLKVLVIGTATDVASALLLDPEFEHRIEVIAMGFSGWPAGGDPWNVKNDRRAWQILLESRVPLTIGCEDVCRTHLRMTRDKASQLLLDVGASGRYLLDLLVNWLDANGATAESVTQDRGAWPVWDEVVTAHLKGWTTVREVARPHLNDDLSFRHAQFGFDDGNPVRWITAVNEERLWRDLRRCLRAAAQRVGT